MIEMKSLREEIYDYLVSLPFYINKRDGNLDEELTSYTDEIISKIVKRIDELRQNYPKDTGTEQPSNLLYNQLLGIDQFYNQVKEMLK